MAIRVALHHKTSYRYDHLVEIFPQIVRLRPAPHCRTPIVSYSLKVRPDKQFLNWQQDPYGNYLARLVFPEKAQQLEVEVDLVAEMVVINPFDFFLEPAAEKFPFKYEPALCEELRPYLALQPDGERLAMFLADVPRVEQRTVDFLVDLNMRVHKAVNYTIRLEPGVKTCEQTLADASGSCRDSAWLLVQALRHLGLAARFVSGYLIQLTADVKSLDGPSGPEKDFTDLHAWTEVYLPGAGWIGLDPTSGLFAGEGHIPLAATPDPSAAAPITGAVEPCEVEFNFEMSVERVYEDPRVTKPYTGPQWEAIEALGHRLDAELEAGAVHLTMGGEPTFVSIDDYDSPEWNTTALGEKKRHLAGRLVKRLREQFAPGGLLHYGQGKWYPGEQLPRWALGCYWRRDGEPVWTDPDLIANDEDNLGHGMRDAQRFVTRFAERLRVDVEHVIPAYEDVWYYMWRERRLPTNVDPLKSELKDPMERKRISKIFERGLNEKVGFVLPVRRAYHLPNANWMSGPWFFRQEHMFLVPGDSPIGFRLPLDSLPWLAPEDQPQQYPLDPFAPRGPLPKFHGQVLVGDDGVAGANGWHGGNGHDHGGGNPYSNVTSLRPLPSRATIVTQGLGQSGLAAAPGLDTSVTAEALATRYVATQPRWQSSLLSPTVVRTAICVEPRKGLLHVFMPPCDLAEDYLELVATLEQTAEELELPIVIEGYPPPHDHRLNHLKVTPDPGVIEVNVQPAHNWDECVRTTTILYEEARQCRLGTEKFLIDGRHTGTGGGNHVVLGGPTPAQSPFLRRPDLLRSLLAYWNNHPSLSYLLAGLFVGPTSQSPRVDEARHESLYELDIAFEQIRAGQHCPPWLVDRLFRHLLVDLTGNTHRAEFCIDKLFSPDSSSGRLGLVEFRAFEMPPHARMSLTQQLLVRSLIARFWKQPYTADLVRWGTALHDRFMLPHFIAQDFGDVVFELNEAGYALEEAWFAPHFEFRFPKCGDVTYSGVEIELRTAIEPWHVLGEEGGAGGTTRAVDSSLERMQVKVNGLNGSRYIVACNGRRVPLHPTGTVGQYVAGVRYRAWQPPSCLHPTIPVHTPLVFDVIDTWNRRSIGGCTWHVAHPGGRSHETAPVNALEAESRRIARFFKIGHTPGKRGLPPREENPDYPLTLDLRRGTHPAGLG